MNENANDDLSESIESITDNLTQWYPRDILRRTNWLYRMDSLRNHDVREMSLLWEITELFQDYATSFLVWAHSLKSIINITSDLAFTAHLEKLFDLVRTMSELFLSEGYCCFLDFMQIAYYPSGNRITSANNGDRFSDHFNCTIRSININHSKDMTGLSINQLLELYKHLRFPETMSYPARYKFSGEEVFLHFMVFL